MAQIPTIHRCIAETSALTCGSGWGAPKVTLRCMLPLLILQSLAAPAPFYFESTEVVS